MRQFARFGYDMRRYVWIPFRSTTGNFRRDRRFPQFGRTLTPLGAYFAGGGSVRLRRYLSARPREEFDEFALHRIVFRCVDPSLVDSTREEPRRTLLPHPAV